MKNRFNTKTIIDELNGNDLFQSWDSHKEVIGYIGAVGNCFLYFKVNKTFISLKSGFQLTKAEKKLKWYYQNYDDPEELAVDLYKFVNKYNKSFHWVRKHK